MSPWYACGRPTRAARIPSIVNDALIPFTILMIFLLAIFRPQDSMPCHAGARNIDSIVGGQRCQFRGDAQTPTSSLSKHQHPLYFLIDISL